MKAVRFIFGVILGATTLSVVVSLFQYEVEYRQYRKEIPLPNLLSGKWLDRLVATSWRFYLRELTLVTLSNMGVEGRYWIPSLKRTFSAYADAYWWIERFSELSELDGRHVVEVLAFLEPIDPDGPKQMFMGGGHVLSHPSQN